MDASTEKFDFPDVYGLKFEPKSDVYYSPEELITKAKEL